MTHYANYYLFISIIIGENSESRLLLIFILFVLMRIFTPSLSNIAMQKNKLDCIDLKV